MTSDLQSPTYRNVSDSVYTRRRYASAGTSYGPVSVCVRVRLYLSVTSRSSIKTDERIELVFGTGASFDQRIRGS